MHEGVATLFVVWVITSQWQCEFYCSCVCVYNNEIILAKILGGGGGGGGGFSPSSPSAPPPSYAPAQLLFTEQPSGQKLNIVTSAIIWIVQGFISEAWKRITTWPC